MFCISFASGVAERFSESTDISLADPSLSELADSSKLFLRFLCDVFRLGGGFAHSGTGYSRSNCCRKRLIYSLPVTRSSASVCRSFRSRGLDAKDTTMRSSSLSTHAGASRAFSTSSSYSEDFGGARDFERAADVAVSRKNS